MNIGDKVVIISDSTEEAIRLHCFNYGQICEIVEIDDETEEVYFRVKCYYHKEHREVKQWVLDRMVEPYAEQTHKSN